MKLPLPPVPAGLMLLSLVLCVDLLYQISAPPEEFHPAPTTLRLPTAAPGTHKAFMPPPETDFSEIDGRSMFSPQRKPMQSLLSDYGGSEGNASDLALVGIIMGPDKRIAVLKTTGSAAAQNVSVGGTIRGWRVTRIESDYIVLHANSGDQDVKMPLRFNEHSTNAPPAQTGPAQVQQGQQGQYAPPPVTGDDSQNDQDDKNDQDGQDGQ